MWLTAAVFSAVFAALTAILAKCGIRKTDSDVATAIRTAVVLVFSWIMVFISGSAGSISQISAKSLIFLTLSALLGVGTLLMVEKKQTENSASGKGYLLYAVGSAVFAAATSILAKVGISGVESNLATAIRTAVVLVMAWLIVIIKGKLPQLKMLDKKELGFIALSGLATGGSWLCYYYAIQNGVVSVVVPIDKMSLLPTVIFSYFVFKEKLSKKATLGLALMLAGTLAMAIFA